MNITEFHDPEWRMILFCEKCLSMIEARQKDIALDAKECGFDPVEKFTIAFVQCICGHKNVVKTFHGNEKDEYGTKKATRWLYEE